MHPITQTITQQPTGQPKDKQAGKQILQNLIMHRKVCNHPMFVAEELKDKQITNYLSKKTGEELEGYELSGKLMGLVDKLMECEIIERKEGDSITTTIQDSNNEGLMFVDLATNAAP